ncbi:MAG TPA: type IV toxin-antitoxin system AbiEi family antitoxin [Planctomycetota bacterium]|nr:type IV toxin-antitoxin system AbiEi family antitoxin [Planctomycetota bacterium]
MKAAIDRNIAPYLEHLKAIPFIAEATAASGLRAKSADRWRTTPLTLVTTTGRRSVEAYMFGSNLDYLRAEALAKLAQEKEGRLLLLAAYVTPPMARFLGDRGVNFVDLHGNCRIVLDDTLHAEIIGKRRVETSADKGWRSAGYWALFTLLVEPTLLRKSVRSIAAASGAGKSAVADAIARLRAADALADGTEADFLPGARARWAQTWIEGYASAIRPASVIGRFRTPARDPARLEADIAAVFGDDIRAFGGAAGAHRLGGPYRSGQTVLHVKEFDDERRRVLRALPAQDGELTVLRTPCPTAYAGEEGGAAHPLLVYAEISATAGPADDRLRQAGRYVREKHLHWL